MSFENDDLLLVNRSGTSFKTEYGLLKESIIAGAGGAIVSETEPTGNHHEGDFWYQPSTDNLFVWVVSDTTGVVTSVSVRNGGSGYVSNETNVATIGGDGEGLTLDIQAGTGGNYASPTVNQGGSGYAVSNVVFLTGAGNQNGSATVTAVNTVATGAWEPAGAGGDFLPLAGGNLTGGVTQTERSISGGFDLATGNFWNCDVTTVPATSNGVNGQSGLIRISTVPTGWNTQFSNAPQTVEAGDIIPFYVLSETSIALGTSNSTGTGGGNFYAGASAWGSVAGSGTLNGGLNVSSSRTSQGQYSVVFDNAMPNANYAVTLGSTANNIAVTGSLSATGFSVSIVDNAFGLTDANWWFAVHSSNALPPRGGTGADAWGYVTTAQVLVGSFNCTITPISDGNYTVNFNTPMPDDHYAVVATGGPITTVCVNNKSENGFNIRISDNQGNDVNSLSSFVVHATNAQLPDTITMGMWDALVARVTALENP